MQHVSDTMNGSIWLVEATRVRTDFVYPPIPDRSHDWCAVDDRTYDGEGGPIGYGETEAAAIEDLLSQLTDDETEAAQ